MKTRNVARRRTRGATGRTYSICGLAKPRPGATNVRDGRSNMIVAWFSGATLLLAVSLSFYAIARPPGFPTDPTALHGPAALERYSVADFFNAVR